MNSKLVANSDKGLEEIWHQVPPDYYQKGVKVSLFQRIWHTRKLQVVLQLIAKSHMVSKKILDVGCASGWFLSQVALKYPNAESAGVDVYKDAISYGNKLYPLLHLQYADGHSLPFSDKSFDLVICTEVLEHVLSPEKVLREIKRVMTSNGIAIIEMDTGNFLFRAVWYWWTNLRHGVWKDSHIHAFNTKKLERLIITSGFSIAEKKIFNVTMAVAYRLVKTK